MREILDIINSVEVNRKSKKFSKISRYKSIAQIIYFLFQKKKVLCYRFISTYPWKLHCEVTQPHSNINTEVALGNL